MEMGGLAHEMTEDVIRDCAVPNSCMVGQTPGTWGLLGTLWGHWGFPLDKETCIGSAHKYSSWLWQAESKAEYLQLVALALSVVRLAAESWLHLGRQFEHCGVILGLVL